MCLHLLLLLLLLLLLFVVSIVPTPTLIICSPLTEALIYQMGRQSLYANVRVLRVEKDISVLIDSAIEYSLALLLEKVARCEWLVQDHGVRLENLTVILKSQ